MFINLACYEVWIIFR